MALSITELQATVAAVIECGGNRGAAAERLGLTTVGIYARLKRCRDAGLDVPEGPGRRRPQASDKEPAAGATTPSATDEALSGPAGDSSSTFAAADQRSRRELWRKYVAGGRADVEMRNYLLHLELPQLQQAAARLASRLPEHVELADLVQVGSIGLLDVAKKYDPERSAFWTYAYPRVMGTMLDLLRHNDHVPRLTRLREAKRRSFERGFEKEHGRPPTSEETQAGLGWTLKELTDSYPLVLRSADEPTHESESGRLDCIRDVLAATEAGPDAAMVRQSFFEQATRGLTFDDQILVWLYFVHGATMKSIGLVFQQSEARVSQRMSAIASHIARRWRRDDLYDACAC